MLFFSITVNIILIWIIFGKEWWIRFYCLNSSEQVTPRWGQFQTTSWPVSALLTWACVSSTVLQTLSTSSQSNHLNYTTDQIWIILVNLRNWVLGLGVCRLTTFMSYFTVAVSVFLLLALTLERWDDRHWSGVCGVCFILTSVFEIKEGRIKFMNLNPRALDIWWLWNLCVGIWRRRQSWWHWWWWVSLHSFCVCLLWSTPPQEHSPTRTPPSPPASWSDQMEHTASQCLTLCKTTKNTFKY